MEATRLPAYNRFAGPGPLTFLWVPGFSGHPWMSATLSRTPGLIRPESMFGFINQTRDSLITVGIPPSDPAARDRYFDRLLAEINGPTVAVGLSTGAAVVNELYRRAVAAGQEQHLCVVLHSGPGSLAALKKSLPALVRLAGKFRFARTAEALLKRVLWIFFIKPRDWLKLYRQHTLWVVLLLRDSIRATQHMLANLRLLIADGLGPPLSANGHIITLNLAPRRRLGRLRSADEVMSVDKSLAVIRAAYSDFTDAAAFTYHGTHHGVVEVDGPDVAGALLQIRDYCLHVFGLS